MRSNLTNTRRVLEAAMRAGEIPGAVAGVIDLMQPMQAPSRELVIALGSASLVPSKTPMALDTVFDLASLTKILVSTLFARLVDRGWITYETPVAAVLAGVPPAIEFRHLLSHSAGYVAWRPFWEQMRDHFGGKDGLLLASIEARQSYMRRLVLSVRPDVGPGVQAVYSDVSFLLLGFAIENLLSLPLDEALQRHLFEPLELEGLHFNRVTQDQAGDPSYAATEDCPWRGQVLRGQVHDDNGWAMGGYAGHAGVFGRLADVLKFAHVLKRANVLQPHTLKKMWSKVNMPVGSSRTLGWDTPSGESPSLGKFFSPHSVGHLGFTGVSLWIDLDYSLGIVLLTNRVHPSRNNESIRALRIRFHEALAQDLEIGPE